MQYPDHSGDTTKRRSSTTLLWRKNSFDVLSASSNAINNDVSRLSPVAKETGGSPKVYPSFPDVEVIPITTIIPVSNANNVSEELASNKGYDSSSSSSSSSGIGSRNSLSISEGKGEDNLREGERRSPTEEQLNNVAKHREHDNKYENTPLFAAFKPLLFSLAILGMLHRRRSIDGGNTEQYFNDKKSRCHCELPTLSQIYCWAVTIMAWALTVRAAITIRLVTTMGPVLISSITVVIYFALCALNATSFLRTSHNPRSIRKFFTGFVKLQKLGGAVVCPIKTKKYILIGTVITWLFVVINHAIVSYLILGTQFFDTTVSDPLDPAANPTAVLVLKIAYFFFFFYLNALWMFPSPLQLSIAIIIYKEFGFFSKSLHKQMTKDKRFTGSLEQQRRRFEQMLKIVAAVDSGLSIHQAASFVCNLANICFFLYIIIYYPTFLESFLVMLAFIYWFVYALADIIVVIISGILINTAVCI